MTQFDPAFRDRLLANPEAAVDEFKLTPQERQALLEGNVAALFQMGSHGFLLGHLSRWGAFGLTSEKARGQLRTLLSPADRARLEAQGGRSRNHG
jgi:hypothetical protein